MSLLSSRTFWSCIALTVILTAAATYKLGPKKIEYKEKIVTQIQERVKTHTTIRESPDGTRVTIIDTDSRRQSETVSERSSKQSRDSWQVVTTYSQNPFKGTGPVYGLGLTRSLILGFSGGLYITTEQPIGVIITKSF